MKDPFGYDYPAGAQHDPNAPWNQPEPVEEDYELTVRCWRKAFSDEDAQRDLIHVLDKAGYDVEVLRVEKDI